MIVATVVRNVLDPANGREIIHLAPGTTYEQAVDILFPEKILDLEAVEVLGAERPRRAISFERDIAVAIDGRQITPEGADIIPDKASLVLCLVPYGGSGGNKGIMRIVASLAMAVGGFYLGGTTWAAGIGSAIGLPGAAVGGVVGIVGSMIINAMLPVDTAKDTSQKSSPTYAWDVQGNPVQAGGPVPELYGKHRVMPPMIGKYVEQTSDGNEQTLNLLYAVAKWLLDSISGFQINGEDLSKYSLPDPEIRLGGNVQEIIQAFDDTRLDTAVGQELTTDWIERTTQGNEVTGIGIGIVFPGLCELTSDGTTNASVSVQLQFKKSTDPDWTTLQVTNEQEQIVYVDRWSGGYWDYQGESGDYKVWKELEVGSTNQADHTDGDIYTPDPSVWIVPGYPDFSCIQPVCYWRWLTGQQTIIPAGSTMLDYVIITANKTSTFRKVWYKTQLPPGEYQARIKFYQDPPHDDTKYINDCTWEFFEEIIEDNLTYPNVALAAVRALATSKLSGSMPTITMIAERLNVWVWDPYSSAYVQKSASNPAWICYDLIHKCRMLENPNSPGTFEFVVLGEPADMIKFDKFSEWADWCDNTDGNKVAYTCNIYFDAFYNLRKALDIVGLCGRGSVIQLGAEFSCIIEKPEDNPVQRFLFTAANIERDTYKEEILALTDRANAIEITYRDEDDDYALKTIEIHTDDYDTTTDPVKKTSLDLLGCTVKQMAINFGKYLLNYNWYCTAMASWTADIDAIACIPGDIVDVPKVLIRSDYSGRLLSGSTASTLQLDRPVVLYAGVTYHVVIKHQDTDEREEGTVLTGAGTVSTISVSGLSRAPAADALFSIGEQYSVSRMMRVIKTSRISDMKRKITAIEFYNEVFDDSGATPYFPPTPGPQQLVPYPLDSVTIELFSSLNTATKLWGQYIRVTFNQDLSVINKAGVTVSNVRFYIHLEDGETPDNQFIRNFEFAFDWTGGFFEIPAESFAGKTIYITATQVSTLGVESVRCPISYLYVDTNYLPAPSISNVEIDSFDYTNNGSSGYSVYFHWAPYGWQLVNGKYAPITDWNGGSNYYVFSKYCVVWGYVSAQGEIPSIATMMSYNTADIGNIFDLSGNMITDADSLDLICRNAASGCIQAQYSDKWVAITVFPVMKNGTQGVIDGTQPDYGLDWEYIRVTMPGGTGATVEDNEITNAELIYTMQAGTVFLCEMDWDYALQAPAIDAFAIIWRVQPYQWAWVLATGFSSTETNFINIIYGIDINSVGGPAAAEDFGARYQEWVDGGIQFFYMLVSMLSENGTLWECIKIDTQTLVVERGVEGSIARDWPAGASIYYAPCEQIDAFAYLADTTTRSYTFNPPLPVDFALHCTIIAFKLTPESPGYKRSHYAFWDLVRAR